MRYAIEIAPHSIPLISALTKIPEKDLLKHDGRYFVFNSNRPTKGKIPRRKCGPDCNKHKIVNVITM